MTRSTTTVTSAAYRTIFLTILVIGVWGSLGAQSWKSGETTFTLSRDGTLRVSGKGPMRDLGSPWESDVNSSITTVVIEEGVTHIGERVFSSLRKLKSVTIPHSVTFIGKSAFQGSGLTSIIIPNSVTSIEDETFYSCNDLTSITIPGSVRSIGEGAFFHCFSLTSITIPGSVKFIGGGAFDACTSLTSINVSKDNPSYSSVDGVLFNKAQDTLIQYPNAKQGSVYVIPNSVTTIGAGAFNHSGGLLSSDIMVLNSCFSNLTSVTIPNSVISIEGGAFGYTCLTSVTIPSSVTKIESSTFSSCIKLTSITIPRNVTSIERWAFMNCKSLTSVTSLNPVPPVIDRETFLHIPPNAILYVPVSGLNAYKKAPVWRNFKNIQPQKEG